MTSMFDLYDFAWLVGMVVGALTQHVPWWGCILLGVVSVMVVRIVVGLSA